MKCKFKLDNIVKLRTYESKHQHWTRFIFELSIGQEVICIPIQVSIYSTVISCWKKTGENDEEILKRVYAFLRTSSEQHFRGLIQNGLDALKEDVKDGKLIHYEIKHENEANEKRDYRIGEEFVIEI
jgi:hypothetical protein